MAKPWEGISTVENKLAHLEGRIRLNEEVDGILEKCMQEHKTLSASFDRVFAHLRKALGAEAAFVRTVGESLSMETFPLGIEAGVIEKVGRDMFEVVSPARFVRTGLAWHVIPLEMGGEQIGVFGLALPASDARPEVLVCDLMYTVAEELDQFFFAIQESRRKQLSIEAMQLALKNPILVQAVDEAVSVLQSSVPIRDLLLLYLDEDMEGRPQVQYIVYRESRKAFDSVDQPMADLDALIAKKGGALLDIGNQDLGGIMPTGGLSETRLIDGLVKTTLVGKMVLRPLAGSAFSLGNREIIQIFTEALRQRMVDYNREKKILRKSFSPEVTRRLIRTPDYGEALLTPRSRDIGILYADISGFTKMSEQILRDPSRIGAFINGWSYGCVECVYRHGGVFDKMVGDCIIGLFGPPFHSEAAAEIAGNTVQAALEIRAFTREYFDRLEYSDVREHPLFPDLGVAIGVNYCPANVGLFGPDQDFTCFSSGMNNTARLQGLAKAYQLLVMDSMKEVLEAAGAMPLHEGPLSAAVKNVKNPLVYYMLK
ncbi:MAG: adenylate/guanylate cyclase domain-containing protein [Deltaproteobacteria bacterium]|nr:adenylate/guanylate cyclase domain-containing protein [Deltaproteobacteria bacterium]